MSHEAFTRIAPHYDALMRSVPYEMWVSYLELLWARHDHHPQRALDVCCGTGRVCELLASKIPELAGVDKSTPMILHAREKAGSQGLPIDYFDQDIATMDLGRTFDTAFSLFDSLNYLHDPNHLRCGLHRVAAHLESGALFVFDLNTEYAFVNKMFDQQSMSKGAEVRYKWRSEYDAASRICTVRMRFWVGEPAESFEEIHVQRAHTEAEMREWLGDAGFKGVETYDSYTLNRPNATSDRVHYVAVRR
jgi:SAM-dependent methyltransferase